VRVDNGVRSVALEDGAGEGAGLSVLGARGGMGDCVLGMGVPAS